MRIVVIALSLFLSVQSLAQDDDWSSYGKDSGGGHYSKASEINPKNVKNLDDNNFSVNKKSIYFTNSSIYKVRK